MRMVKTAIETLEFEIAPGRVAEVEAVVERCGGRRIAPEGYLAAEDPHADGRLSVLVVLAPRQDGTHGAVLSDPLRVGRPRGDLSALPQGGSMPGQVRAGPSHGCLGNASAGLLPCS